MNLNLAEAKAHLGRYVGRAAKGKRFVICARNRPLAELRGLPDADGAGKPLALGGLKGRFRVPGDFNAPLPDFEASFYAK